VTARALSDASLTLGEELAVLAGPILVELIDRQERLARLHVLDIGVAVTARRCDFTGRELSLVTRASTFREVPVGLLRVSSMASLASNPSACVHVVLP
jgi:hypothetical protein